MPKGQAVVAKVTWDDATDRKLLMAIIKAAGPSLPKFADVAAIMGDGFTTSVVG